MKTFREFLHENASSFMKKNGEKKLGSFEQAIKNGSESLDAKFIVTTDETNTYIYLDSRTHPLITTFTSKLSIQDATKETMEFFKKLPSGGLANAYRTISKFLDKETLTSKDTNFSVASIYVNSRGRQVIVLSKAIKNGVEVWREHSAKGFLYLNLSGVGSTREDTIKKLKQNLTVNKFKFSEGEDLLA